MSDPQLSALRKVTVPEPWPAAEATHRFRAMAVNPLFEISFKLHAEDQMAHRGITMPDVIFAMKHGFVYDNAVPAIQPGLYRYTIIGGTPSSERNIKVVMIPSMHKASAKIVTVMWSDEARG